MSITPIQNFTCQQPVKRRRISDDRIHKIYHESWSDQDLESLQNAAQIYNNKWTKIADEIFPDKTPRQCQSAWQRMQRAEQPFVNPSFYHSKRREWSREDELKLLELAEDHNKQWSIIAPLLNRTPCQCLEKYNRIIANQNRPARTPWTEAETESLKTAVYQFGQHWNLVAQEVGRSAKNCERKWRRLRETPSSSSYKAWSQEEIKTLQESIENQLPWEEIQSLLPGRTISQCQCKAYKLHNEKNMNRGRWSNDEQSLLIEAVDLFPNNWRAISNHVKTRSPLQCSNKWTDIENRGKTN